MIEPLFPCPLVVTGGQKAAARVEAVGLAAAMRELTQLDDYSRSEAWRDWHKAAGLPYSPSRNALIIPDPNVRVRAVVDDQGVALNDALCSPRSTQASSTRSRR